MCVYIYIYIYIYIYMSRLSLSLSLSIYLPLYLYKSIYIYIYMYISTYISLSLSLSPLSLSVSIYLCLGVSVRRKRALPPSSWTEGCAGWAPGRERPRRRGHHVRRGTERSGSGTNLLFPRCATSIARLIIVWTMISNSGSAH